MSGKLPAMSLAVVGIAYANADGSSRKANIERMRPGDPIELVPEPDNEHDRYAVAVVDGHGRQLGYVTAERAPRIGSLIREGRELRAVFQGVAQTGAWIRVAFDGDEPIVSKMDEPEEDVDTDWGC